MQVDQLGQSRDDVAHIVVHRQVGPTAPVDEDGVLARGGARLGGRDGDRRGSGAAGAHHSDEEPSLWLIVELHSSGVGWVVAGTLCGRPAVFCRRLYAPVMRVVDVMMSFPDILLAIALV